MDALTGFVVASCLLWVGLGALVARMAAIQRGMERRLRLLELESRKRNDPGRNSHD